MSAEPYLDSCRMGSDEKRRPPQLCGEYIWIALTNSFERRAARPGQLTERLTHDFHQIQGHR